MDTSQQVVQSMPQYAEIVLKALEELRKIFETMAENRKDKQACAELANYIRDGGEIKTFIARDYSEKDFMDELKKLGVTCVTARITSGPYKGLIACMVKEEDVHLAMIAREKALSKGSRIIDGQGNIQAPTTEMNLASLNSKIRDDKSYCMTTNAMCESKAKYMIEELRTKNIPFSRKEVEKEIEVNGIQKKVPMTIFYFSGKDKEKVALACAKTDIEFSGISGNYKNQTMKETSRNTEKTMEYIDSTSASKEFYVVSMNNPNNIIHVEGHKITHEITDDTGASKSYRAVDGLYDHVNMQRVYKEEVDSMRNPLIFTEDEYNKAVKDKEYMQQLLKTKCSYPQYRNEMDKINCYTERKIKALFHQRNYQDIAKGIFNPQQVRMELQNVLENGYPLDAFLNPANEDDIQFLNSLSENERKIAEHLLNECVEIYEKSDDLIQTHTITAEEQDESLEDLIREAEETMDYSLNQDSPIAELDVDD